MSMPRQPQITCAPSLSFCHCTGAGSIDWHCSQLQTTTLTATLETVWSILCAKYFNKKTSLPTGKRHLYTQMLQQKESCLDWPLAWFFISPICLPMQMNLFHRYPVHARCGFYTWRLGKWGNTGAWDQVGYCHFHYICLKVYQPLWVVYYQNHPWRRTVIILFNP